MTQEEQEMLGRLKSLSKKMNALAKKALDLSYEIEGTMPTLTESKVNAVFYEPLVLRKRMETMIKNMEAEAANLKKKGMSIEAQVLVREMVEAVCKMMEPVRTMILAIGEMLCLSRRNNANHRTGLLR